MSQIADNGTRGAVTSEDASALNGRILRAMCVSTIVAVFISVVWAPWRVSTGLILGGALSILNYHWLHSSVAAIVELNTTTRRVRARSSRYLLRYFVLAVAVFGSYQLRWVSLAATLVGLCAFVPALMFEALRQFYFLIIHREESY